MKVEITYWCRPLLRPGDVADLPDAVAEQLVKDKHARAAGPRHGGEAAHRSAETDSAEKGARRGRLPVPPKPKPESPEAPDDGGSEGE